MKERLLKWGMMLFLIAVMVVAGVYPVTSSQAAAKGTTYNVVLQKGSTSVLLVSVNDGPAIPQLNPQEAISFQMVVEAKAKTEKVKSTGAKAEYYPVTILKKSYRGPTSKMPMVGGEGMAIVTPSLAKDAKGKFYINGGDVDVSQVMGEKKLSVKLGDGKADPGGSLIIPIIIVSTVTLESTGKVFMQTKTSTYLTTGQSYTIVKGSKSGLEGKALPDNDTTKSLSKPLVGESLDLDAGTGTLVATSSLMNVKNKTMGIIDYLSSQVWVMKITK